MLSTSSLYQAVRYLKPEGAVMDFGCGIGQHTQQLALHSRSTVGFDITNGMLQQARTTYDKSPILFGQIDGIHLPLESNSLDFIWVCGVLSIV